MEQISEHVYIDTQNSSVSLGNEKWVKVENLDNWINRFQNECEDFVKEHGSMCSSIVEENAFDSCIQSS